MSNIDTVSYNRAGQIFTGANISAKIITVVGTGMTGAILYNPVGSSKKCIIMTAGFTWTTIPPSAQAIGLALGAASIIIPASTTVVTTSVQAADGSGTVGSAKFFDV